MSDDPVNGAPVRGEAMDAVGAAKEERGYLPIVPSNISKPLAGWSPGWKRSLRAIVGDGTMLFAKLHDLAMGVAQTPCDGHGRPIMRSIRNEDGDVIGQEPVVIFVPPAVQRAAATELLDRLFGKPIQVVVDATPDGVEKLEYVAASELSESELAIVRQIARRRMLGRAAESPAVDSPEKAS